jgi:hypothetical protein
MAVGQDEGGSLDEVKARFATAIGKAAWGTAMGEGSFLTVEIGDAVEQVGRKMHGEFHLWIYCSAWRIETPLEVLASSEDDRDTLKSRVGLLDGRSLDGIEIEQPSLSATFRFSGDVRLRTFSIFTHDVEHWLFYLPDGAVFTAGPSSRWSWSR